MVRSCTAPPAFWNCLETMHFDKWFSAPTTGAAVDVEEQIQRQTNGTEEKRCQVGSRGPVDSEESLADTVQQSF
ncbi:hypothetical protein AK812_SmicGene41079 [Symbiodinium microadriaticum]|uniref:Uncharacterized protein n=1 Tax=Symbiodinium microadriaticum TaxID=2951 RepID=A0A1Q9C711_SYMMI|nr:hypothetical protein AK812_SmicGene41079 [Symbiodinium microadriaticum]